ncbi:MAG: hypothetical protein M1820_002571 [Bogoriella megaspora]|nr:MAG: hypothetical protein M1820_002571 [Bogoriella megaspora]
MANTRTVLITGCSEGGLGDQLAQTFHARGLRVLATARNLDSIKHLTGQGIETLPLDVTSPESISSCVETVSKLTGGSLDILLNNAGGGYTMPLADVDIETGKKVFEANVWGFLRVTQAFLPLLLKSSHPAGGFVVNNTSAVSVIANPIAGVYNMSKAAAGMMTETLRLELMPFGIKVIDLKTASVRSRFYDKQAQGPKARLPEDSIYSPARDVVENIMTEGSVGLKFMPQEDWAKEVVESLLKRDPAPHIWSGASATLIRVLTSIVPFTWRDSTMLKMGGLDILSQRLKDQKKVQ